MHKTVLGGFIKDKACVPALDVNGVADWCRIIDLTRRRTTKFLHWTLRASSHATVYVFRLSLPWYLSDALDPTGRYREGREGEVAGGVQAPPRLNYLHVDVVSVSLGVVVLTLRYITLHPKFLLDT